MHDRFNAFVDVDPDAKGGAGPLAGLRIGIKSNIAVKRLPWTAGMGTRRDIVATHDAHVVARLRAAGAVIQGTLNMHEAALGATTDNFFYGRTHNPHRHDYTPGGSSGGSGAAVAASLVDAALGTDTLGSIRIPAAYCGVYGLKPTLGAVRVDGLVHLGSAFDVIGPLARDLDVLERIWSAMSEPGETVDGLKRLLVLPSLDDVNVEPAIRDAYDRTVAALAFPTSEMALVDPLSTIRLSALAPCVVELVTALGDARHGKGVSEELRAVIDAVEQIPPAPNVLQRTRGAMVDALGADGLLVMPTTPHAAFAHGGRAPASQADFTSLASVAGLPAIAIPAGVDANGLPIGIQIVGPANSERALIALARQLEPVLGGSVPLAKED